MEWTREGTEGTSAAHVGGGRGMDWTREGTLKLISEIHKRPAIWDLNSEEYKDKNKRRESFEEIARIFHCSRDLIEKKYANFRSQYNRALNKWMVNGASPGGEDSEPKWFAFKYLAFLYPGSGAKGALSGINVKEEVWTLPENGDSRPEAGSGPDAASQLAAHLSGDGPPPSAWHDPGPGPAHSWDGSVEPAPASWDDADGPTPRKRPRTGSADGGGSSELLDEAIAALQLARARGLRWAAAAPPPPPPPPSHSAARSPADECARFGESVAAQLRAIRSRRVRSLAKLNIQKALFDAESADADADADADGAEDPDRSPGPGPGADSGSEPMVDLQVEAGSEPGGH